MAAQSSTGLLAAALRYAAAGLPVLPLHTPEDGGCSCGRPGCERPGKHPRWHPDLITAGLQDASVDPDRIRAWWERWPSANIGLRTGIVADVCDVDTGEGGAALRTLLGDGAPAHGPAARTGSGGWHLYLAPTGSGNRVRLLPGVDWRGAGGYVIGPPSLHASGGRYTWVRGLDLDLPPCPEPLRALLFPPVQPRGEPVRHPERYAAAALANEVDRVARAPVGQRNNTLYRAARSLGELVAIDAIDEYDVRDALRVAAARARLGAPEITRTIRSGLRAGRRHPRPAA